MNTNEKKNLVISGINLFEGGPLSIYYDCLDEIINQQILSEYSVTIFVHSLSLFEKYKNYFEIIELPKSRNSYFMRLYYEYIWFYSFSKSRTIDIWVSLHDITPRVKAKKIYTYCHNPAPFMETDLSKIKYSFVNVAFSLFYKYLYRINIRSATALIVQSDWMRKEFLKRFPIKNVIVARPSVPQVNLLGNSFQEKSNKTIFVYAAFPRFFKNFEVVCEASSYLQNNDYEIWLTISGKENRYASDIYNRFCGDKNIKWLGIRTRKEIYDIYRSSDCMVFPSILETWGLPISEYKLFGKPILLSDLPYARETVGTYSQVSFFDPHDAKKLAEMMKHVIAKTICFEGNIERGVAEPYCHNWKELIVKVLS